VEVDDQEQDVGGKVVIDAGENSGSDVQAVDDVGGYVAAAAVAVAAENADEDG
jgi:hypothetical protein